LGDVLGPLGSEASRLISTARPGRVLIDRALADELKQNERFKLRKLRRTSVKGYRTLEHPSMSPAADEDPEPGEGR